MKRPNQGDAANRGPLHISLIDDFHISTRSDARPRPRSLILCFVRSMRSTLVAAFAVVLVGLSWLGAEPQSRAPQIVISEKSIRIDGVEIRTARHGYISLAVVERQLGKPQDIYPAGLGVGVHAWRNLGIHIQRGWRGPEKGKFFKFQVWLVDDYDKDEDKHSGRFTGHVRVEGVDIGPDSTLDSVRPQLETAGFHIVEHPGVIAAEKGQITIFTVDTTKKLERVEACCP